MSLLGTCAAIDPFFPVTVIIITLAWTPAVQIEARIPFPSDQAKFTSGLEDVDQNEVDQEQYDCSLQI